MALSPKPGIRTAAERRIRKRASSRDDNRPPCGQLRKRISGTPIDFEPERLKRVDARRIANGAHIGMSVLRRADLELLDFR